MVVLSWLEEIFVCCWDVINDGAICISAMCGKWSKLRYSITTYACIVKVSFSLTFFLWPNSFYKWREGSWKSIQQTALKTFVSQTALPFRIIGISPFSCRETCFPSLFQGLIWLSLWWVKVTTATTSCPCNCSAAGKATRWSWELNAGRFHPLAFPILFWFLPLCFQHRYNLTLAFLWISYVAGFTPLLYTPKYMFFWSTSKWAFSRADCSH